MSVRIRLPVNQTVNRKLKSQTESKMQKKGFGFVSFESEETVNRLVEERFLTINGKKVPLKLSLYFDILISLNYSRIYSTVGWTIVRCSALTKERQTIANLCSLSLFLLSLEQIEIKRAEPQRPMLKSNSSSMTNISMQSSHNNGYLSGLSPYAPLSTPHHQLHAAHHPHSIMPPPAQNALDTSAAAFQFAAAAAYHHPNSYSTAIPIHPHHSAHHSRAENLANAAPLIAGYAPTPLSSQPASHHQLVSHQPWPLSSYPLGPLHSMQPTAPQHHHQPPHHPAMQSSPTALAAHQQAVSIIQNNSAGNLIQPQNAELSRPDSPASLSASNNNSTVSNNPTTGGTPNSQSTNNANLAQLNTSNPIPTPQSVTPTAMHQQNWYPNTHYSSSTPTPVPHPSLGGQPPGLIANPPGPLHGQANPAFSQAITFGYPPAGYVPAGLMSAAHWQQNPYPVYGMKIVLFSCFEKFECSCENIRTLEGALLEYTLQCSVTEPYVCMLVGSLSVARVPYPLTGVAGSSPVSFS